MRTEMPFPDKNLVIFNQALRAIGADRCGQPRDFILISSFRTHGQTAEMSCDQAGSFGWSYR